MKKAVASTLAAVCAVAGLTGCSGSPHRTARATPVAAETTPAPEAVTPQSAQEAFRRFVDNDDVARASGDEHLALWWTSEGQSELTAAAFRTAIAAGEPIPRYRYDNPVFYVPRLRAEDVQWFVVSARRTTADGKDPRTALMGFIQARPSGRWRLSLSALLDKTQKPPKIEVDADGYAKALATFDPGLLIPPRLVPSIQATLAEEGPHNVAAQVMDTGQYTTSYYAADQKATKAGKKAGGVHSSVVYAATSFPIFPLATTDGGGIVLYALERDAVLTKSTPKGAKSTKSTKGAGRTTKKKTARLPIPKDAAPFIDPDLVHDELDVTQMMQYAAIVPAKPAKGQPTVKADIIGADGGTITASVPKH